MTRRHQKGWGTTWITLQEDGTSEGVSHGFLGLVQRSVPSSMDSLVHHVEKEDLGFVFGKPRRATFSLS